MKVKNLPQMHDEKGLPVTAGQGQSKFLLFNSTRKGKHEIFDKEK